MKSLRLLLVVLTLLATIVVANAQNGYSGKVIDIVDGKTVKIEMLNGNILMAELRFIEVPEPEQQFSAIAKDHLATLVLGKIVEFRAERLIEAKPLGKVYLNGVDISQQMIRDGAAWYAQPESSSQEITERETYKDLEARAKVEKRGIWSVDNLTPAWEFRAQKEEQRLQQERAEEQARIKSAQANQAKAVAASRANEADRAKANAQVEIWADVGGTGAPKNPVPGVEGLYAGYDPATKIGYSMTDSKFLNLEAAGKSQKVECRAIYVYRGGLYDPTESAFIIGVMATVPSFRFEKANNLTFSIDKKAVPLGKALRFYRQHDNSAQELLLYKVSKETLKKIVDAKSLRVTVGGFSGPVDKDFQTLINNLLNNL